MEKASPSDMRKALVVVNNFKQAGVLFVPVPVLSVADQQQLIDKANRRIQILIDRAETK